MSGGSIVTTSSPSPQSDVLMMEGGLILSPTFAPSDGVMALHCSLLGSALVQRSPALYFLSVGGPQQGGTNNGQLFDLKHETNNAFMTYPMSIVKQSLSVMEPNLILVSLFLETIAISRPF